jgi:type I restriction enzyme S subunit
MAIELSEKQIKDGWQIVKFGEIAKNISKRVEPSVTDLEVYVGLEHLDPQSLRITRRGVPADVKGQKLRVRPGQIIFGKRRAYQKKVAVADFEGICSAHAMVLEEVVGKIIPGLLPFFMQSDMFMDRAVAISEGSLSPTIKWKTLAIQEFPLPPIERQKEILEVLEKLEEVSNLTIHFNEANGQLIDAVLHKVLGLTQNDKRFTGQDLLKKSFLFALQDGNHGGQYPKSSEFLANGIPYLSAQNVTADGEIILEECPKLSIEKANSLRIGLAQGGDVILTHNATIGRVAIVPDFVDQIVASTSTTYYRTNSSRLKKEYLAIFLRSSFFQEQLFKVMKQSTRNQVPITQQKKLDFIIPEIEEQEKIVELSSAFIGNELLKNKISNNRLIKQQLIADFLTQPQEVCNELQ